MADPGQGQLSQDDAESQGLPHNTRVQRRSCHGRGPTEERQEFKAEALLRARAIRSPAGLAQASKNNRPVRPELNFMEGKASASSLDENGKRFLYFYSF